MANCTVKPPDVEVCKPLPSGKGYCFRVLSLEDRNLTVVEMERAIFKGVVITPKEYAPLKRFILKLCAKDNVCDHESKAIKSKFDKFEKRAGIDAN